MKLRQGYSLSQAGGEKAGRGEGKRDARRSCPQGKDKFVNSEGEGLRRPLVCTFVPLK